MAADRPVLGWFDSTTALHEERLEAVVAHLRGRHVTSVLDLGCGSGALLERLSAEPALERIVGVDPSPQALLAADRRLSSASGGRDDRVALRQGSAITLDQDLAGFDAVVMVETIEHLDPGHLSGLERNLFGRMKPALALITTPNREYNTIHGLAPGEYRHPHHRFEWDRPAFQRWATGVGQRHGYDIAFEGIGPANAWFGSSTQMAVFRRR